MATPEGQSSLDFVVDRGRFVEQSGVGFASVPVSGLRLAMLPFDLICSRSLAASRT